LIPGRLTIHTYEYKIAERWSGAFIGDALAVRTLSQIRNICTRYADIHKYDYIIIDTSPSLGSLNKVIISTVDGFIIPCLPDMFSLYGIRNIGKALKAWKVEFTTLFTLLSKPKRAQFPEKLVRFLGFTIYNAKKYADDDRNDLALAHYNYAKQIPDTIFKFIPEDIRNIIPDETMKESIGGNAVMHSHNTLPNMAQKYKHPIWEIPDIPNLDAEDRPTISGNRLRYTQTKEKYKLFAKDLMKRMRFLS